LTATIGSALGDIFDQIRQIIILWFPPLLLGFLVYLMWRLVKMMPRTSPAELKPDSESVVRWHDVAGVEEQRLRHRAGQSTSGSPGPLSGSVRQPRSRRRCSRPRRGRP
jgi:hypothetical protein